MQKYKITITAPHTHDQYVICGAADDISRDCPPDQVGEKITYVATLGEHKSIVADFITQIQDTVDIQMRPYVAPITLSEDQIIYVDKMFTDMRLNIRTTDDALIVVRMINDLFAHDKHAMHSEKCVNAIADYDDALTYYAAARYHNVTMNEYDLSHGCESLW